jgi:hypothetical protein
MSTQVVKQDLVCVMHNSLWWDTKVNTPQMTRMPEWIAKYAQELPYFPAMIKQSVLPKLPLLYYNMFSMYHLMFQMVSQTSMWMSYSYQLINVAYVFCVVYAIPIRTFPSIPDMIFWGMMKIPNLSEDVTQVCQEFLTACNYYSTVNAKFRILITFDAPLLPIASFQELDHTSKLMEDLDRDNDSFWSARQERETKKAWDAFEERICR